VKDRGRVLPATLAEVHRSRFFVDHNGHDFEPYDEFLWPGETLEWWRAWIGDSTAETPPFQVFGQDGSGGLVALWIRDPDAAIEIQPVVFLGSEGELAVIARDLGDYVWLLANGVGPLETVDGVHRTPEPIPDIVTLARRYTGAPNRPLLALIAAAQAELAALTAFVDAAAR
jgi:hypothetical protein